MRPIVAADVAQWVELHNEVDPQLPVTVGGVRSEREATMLRVLAWLDGATAGYGQVLEQGDMRGGEVAVADFGVPVRVRGRGIGTALYAAVSDHARDLGKPVLQCDLWEDELDGLDFLRKRGFVEVERFSRVRLSLDDAPTDSVAPPSGIEILPAESVPDRAGGMYVVACEAYADMPSTDPIRVAYDDFRGWEVERDSLRGDLSFVAVAGGEIVGFGTVSVPGEDGKEGWHSLTAVARAWRRRGIARALKRAEIAAAKQAGLEGLTTFSELRNTGMRALNERLGYRPLPSQLRLRGPLAPERAG